MLMDKIRVLCSIMTRNGGLMNVILLNINAGFKMEHTGKKKALLKLTARYWSTKMICVYV